MTEPEHITPGFAQHVLERVNDFKRHAQKADVSPVLFALAAIDHRIEYAVTFLERLTKGGLSIHEDRPKEPWEDGDEDEEPDGDSL